MQPMQIQAQAAVRVRALKGFYSVVSGTLTQVNPGDVVDLERGIARDVASKIELVQPGTPLLKQKDYLPERKRNPKADPAAAITALQSSVDALTQAVTALLQRDATGQTKGKG
jgi:hypothetical protein